MRRIPIHSMYFFIFIMALLMGACSWLQKVDAPVQINTQTPNAPDYVQLTSILPLSSTPTIFPSSTAVQTLTPFVSLFSQLQIDDYIVISKRLEGCDRIGPGCTGLFAISQDGEELGTLYSGNSSIYHATLSPNGQKIAFLDPPGYAGDSYSRLVVVDLTTLKHEDVITLQRASGDVVWSNDGSGLLVEVDGNIELIDVLASRRRIVLECKSVWEDQKATDCYPLAWSPDNKWIAVNILSEYSGAQDKRVGTYMMPAGCIDDFNNCASQVEKISDIISIGASWSPDGGSIAISNYLGDIYLYHVGSATITLFEDLNISRPYLAWSPDGRFLAIAGDSNVGLISLQTGQISELEVPNVGEYISVPFWIHR